MRKNDGDPRPIGQLRALTHAELILRPWDTSRPAVTALLTVTAPLPSLTRSRGRGEPGEVDGRPITAAHVRELLAQLDAVCPGGLQAPAGGTLQVAVTDADGALLATAQPRGAGADRPPRLRAEPPGGLPRLRLRGARTGRRRSTATGPPRRSAASARARDRTCRQPGCGQPVARVDLDHVVPYRRRRRDRLRQPLLSVPPAPPAQDPRAGVAVRPHPRRAAGRVTTPERDHPHHPATGPARPASSNGPCPHHPHHPRNRRRSEARPAHSEDGAMAAGRQDPRRVRGSSVGPLTTPPPPGRSRRAPRRRRRTRSRRPCRPPIRRRTPRIRPRRPRCPGARAALTGRPGPWSPWWPRRASPTGGQPAGRSGSGCARPTPARQRHGRARPPARRGARRRGGRGRARGAARRPRRPQAGPALAAGAGHGGDRRGRRDASRRFASAPSCAAARVDPETFESSRRQRELVELRRRRSGLPRRPAAGGGGRAAP